MKPTLSLSTCWNSSRHTDGYAMLKEVAELGFTHVELGHGTRITLVPGILKALQEGIVKVASTHNFCPLPAGITYAAPNLYMPSSPNPRELDQWLRQTCRSIDFARQVGARVLVMHLGRLEYWFFNPAKKIKKYLKAHEADAGEALAKPEYKKLVAKVLSKLRNNAPEYMVRIKDCVERVIPYAAERGIQLGLENREGFDELPLEEAYAELVASLEPAGIAGYWHDTGHAQIKHRAGFIDHKSHLLQNAERLIGFHLHDVNSAGKDHFAVGSGTIDFEMISGFFKPHHLLTIELSPRVRPQDVATSREYVESLLSRQFSAA